MYTSVSNDFKAECKQNVNEYKRIAKIHVVEDDIDITNDDVLIDFTIEEMAYSGGTFVGNSVAKKITLNIINDGSYNLEDKEIEVYVGVDYEGDGSDEELVPYGNFIISKPTNEEVKDSSNYVGYDYMMKAEQPFVASGITYPISLYNYLGAICTKIGVTLGSLSIPNGSYSVTGDAYTNGESYRQIIEDIAKCCGGFAVIGRDNKLYIRTLNVASLTSLSAEDDILIETENEFELVAEMPAFDGGTTPDSENLTPDEYFDDFNSANSYGPVNKVALALNENVIGEDTIMQDTESIAENGIIEVRISDIAFLNSEAQRELCISDVYNTLHNLNYVPFSVNYYGYPYLDSGDFIKVRSVKNGREYFSYVLNHTFTYNGGFSGKVEAPALTDVEEEYKATTNARNALRHTELRVDKINGEISSIVEEIGDRSQKTTTITQDIDGINSSVGIVADLTNVVSGTDPIQLTNCMEGELVELDIYGDNVTFNHLYPATDLYPSTTLYPNGSSNIKIYSKNLTSEAVEVQNDHWHNSLMPPTSANNIHTEIYYDSAYTKDWSSTYIELKPNTGYVFVNINAGSNYRGAIFNDFPFSESYTSTNKISSVQYIGDYTYDWGVSSWISRVNEYTYFKTGTEGSWYLVMNGSFGNTGVYEVVDSIFEELDTKIQDSKFALQPTRRIVTTNSYKSLTVKIPKGIKLIKVTKQPSRRFGLATFKYYPNATNYATNYISNDDYGADVTEYEISVGNDDTYLVVYYYDSDIDNENPTTIKNSIKIYGAYGNYRLVDLQIDEVLRESGNYKDKVVITNGKELLYRYITIVNGEIVIVENPTPTEIQDVSIDLVEGTNYIEVLDYSTYISAKYVQKNEFTKIFATTYEVSSQIQQLANQLNFKVSRGNIISEINMGIDEQNGDIDSYLYMKSNKFKIESDYFNVALDGTIEATEGKIANFNMWRGQANYTTDSGTQATTEASFLTKYCLTNNQGYMSGMIIPDVMQARQFDFIFARSKGNGRESFFVK